MSKHVLLNNVEHKDLRVATRYNQQLGAASGLVLTFPTEFVEVMREYPIFFRKDPETGEHSCVVLLGFNKDENLFLDGERWDASYIPAVIARGPFYIGIQERPEGGELRRQTVIHVDMDDPRVGTTDGERVFLENGGNSPYLERIANLLGAIHEGIGASKAMFEAFTALDLIEPIKLDIKLSGGQYEVVGLLTLNGQKLNDLNAEQVYDLHRKGLLQAAYLILASLNNVRHLIERKQRLEQNQADKAS